MKEWKKGRRREGTSPGLELGHKAWFEEVEVVAFPRDLREGESASAYDTIEVAYDGIYYTIEVCMYTGGVNNFHERGGV